MQLSSISLGARQYTLHDLLNIRRLAGFLSDLSFGHLPQSQLTSTHPLSPLYVAAGTGTPALRAEHIYIRYSIQSSVHYFIQSHDNSSQWPPLRLNIWLVCWSPRSSLLRYLESPSPSPFSQQTPLAYEFGRGVDKLVVTITSCARRWFVSPSILDWYRDERDADSLALRSSTWCTMPSSCMVLLLVLGRQIQGSILTWSPRAKRQAVDPLV